MIPICRGFFDALAAGAATGVAGGGVAEASAGAAALAAALQEKSKLAGKRVGLILSGGNIDFDLFRTWIGTDAAPAAQRAVA